MGWSGRSHERRTPENVVRELHDLIQAAGLKPSYILAGHSLGGLYMQIFARLYPGEIRSAVLLDPLYLEDKFKGRISRPLYKKIIRKESMMKFAGILGAMGLIRLFRISAFGTDAEIPDELKKSYKNQGWRSLSRNPVDGHLSLPEESNRSAFRI
jgi:pimeloyl-ACP methyl ester carboxylesterase